MLPHTSEEYIEINNYTHIIIAVSDALFISKHKKLHVI